MRTIFDLGIYLAQHMVATFLVVLVVGSLIERWAGPGRLGRQISPTFGRNSLIVFSLLLLGGFLAVAGWYVTLGGFAGEVEPTVASLSWLVLSGEPLYHGLDEAARYSVLYGPSVFLTNGMFLEILGPTVASAKMASCLGILGSLLFLYAALARPSRDLVALGVTALAVLFYWSQGFAVYLVRPDSLLLFAVSFGLYSATRTRVWVAVLAVGAGLGFAVNLKVHGAIYFLPVLAVLARHRGVRAVPYALFASVPFIVAPFLFSDQISAANYIGWLGNALHHGLGTETLAETLRFALYLTLPTVAVLAVCRTPWALVKDYLGLFEGMGLALVLALITAAKPGAGLVHMLPLVPTALYLAGRLLRRILAAGLLVDLGAKTSMRRAVVCAVMVTALVTGMVNEYRAVRLVDWQEEQTPDLLVDLKTILARYPDLTVSMAVGGEDASFRHTWLRPLLVFADQPLLLDPIAVMDCRLSGLDLPPETYQAMAEGEVSVWLVPKDREPFAKLNWYAPHGPVFSEKFRTLFQNMYTLRDQSHFFDLWFFNGLPAGTAVSPPVVLRGSSTQGTFSP